MPDGDSAIRKKHEAAQSFCCACGLQQSFLPFARIRGIWNREEFPLGTCPGCGLLKTLSWPGTLRDYYARELPYKYKSKPHPVFRYFKHWLLMQEWQRLQKATHNKISAYLDLGCGIGDFSQIIHQARYPVWAVDASPQRPILIENTPEIPYHLIDYTDYSIAHLPTLPQNSAGILRHVLEHIENPEIFIKKLIPYGITYFYIVVPNVEAKEVRLFKTYAGIFDPPFHIWHFSQRSLKTFFQRIGLEIISQGYDTIPTIVPSLHRYLMVKQYPSWLASLFDPRGLISAASTGINFCLPNNVLWLIARVKTPA